MQNESLPLYVSTDDAAKILGLSRSSLEKYRHYRDLEGLPYVVFGRGAVRYHVPSLLKWAEGRTVRHGAA
ncbi:helix-turn-helix transcriptional regulator [Roseovarius confluentis]|uniref:helix-turn-helix transcriptional regulator n=1 Tax=Roseovarius confluentis TaxID=1852027 RepID=UPI0011AF4392|nr:helix-turn-helix domain-containing protein [Roseovarius confluentis]